MLSERAMIAVCEVRLPRSVAMPRTRCRSIVAVSEGVRLCATRMCGFARQRKRFGGFALQIANDASRHVLDVEGALAQIRIIDLLRVSA